MKIQLIYLLLTVSIVASCNSDSNSQFQYDPTKPYPIFDSGDFWLNQFDQRGLQNVSVYGDHFYCNTVNPGAASYLYCFDLTTGTVKWRTTVDAYATQPVIEVNDSAFYCSYLGHMYVYSEDGEEIWRDRYGSPCGGHWLNPKDGTINMTSPHGDEVTTYRINGELVSKEANPMLKKKIQKIRGKVNRLSKQYTVKHKNKRYTINVSTAPNREQHEIEVIQH